MLQNDDLNFIILFPLFMEKPFGFGAGFEHNSSSSSFMSDFYFSKDNAFLIWDSLSCKWKKYSQVLLVQPKCRLKWSRSGTEALLGNGRADDDDNGFIRILSLAFSDWIEIWRETSYSELPDCKMIQSITKGLDYLSRSLISLMSDYNIGLVHEMMDVVVQLNYMTGRGLYLVRDEGFMSPGDLSPLETYQTYQLSYKQDQTPLEEDLRVLTIDFKSLNGSIDAELEIFDLEFYLFDKKYQRPVSECFQIQVRVDR
jgi:hypothetical protein